MIHLGNLTNSLLRFSLTASSSTETRHSTIQILPNDVIEMNVQNGRLTMNDELQV